MLNNCITFYIGFLRFIVLCLLLKNVCTNLSKRTFLWLERQLFKAFIIQNCLIFYHWNLNKVVVYSILIRQLSQYRFRQNLLGTNPLFLSPYAWCNKCRRTEIFIGFLKMFPIISLLNRKGIYLTLLQILTGNYF